MSPYRTLVALVELTRKYDRWTCAEFIDITGLSHGTSRRLIAMLYERHQVYVDEWRDDARGRNCIAVYAWGDRPDAKRRTALTGRARQAAYLQRRKALAGRQLQTLMSQWRPAAIDP